MGGQSTDDSMAEEVCNDAHTLELTDDQTEGPELGFAPADVVNWLQGVQLTEAEWTVAHGGNDKGTTTTLELTVERAPGAAVQLTCDDPHIQIPVALGLKTADGALNERASGVLVAISDEYAELRILIQEESVAGGIDWQPAESGTRLDALSIDARFTKDGLAGEITGQLVTSASGSETEQSHRMFAWPVANECDVNSVPSTTSGWWTKERVEAVDMTNDAQWHSDGGETAKVTISASESSCKPPQGATSVPAVLEIDTEDGTFLGLKGELAPSNQELEFFVTDDTSGRPEDFEADYGSFSADLNEFDNVSLDVSLQISNTTGKARIQVVGDLPSEGSPMVDENTTLSGDSSPERLIWKMDLTRD